MIKKLLIVLTIVLFASISFAGSVTFEWDTNDEPDLAGYRLWQTQISGDYDLTLPPAAEILLGDPDFDHTGDRCQWTLEDVPDGTYYWVLTAHDADNNQSGLSNEVTATIDSTAPGSPANVNITVVVNVQVN